MSSRQKLIDAATKHQVFMQRYAGGVFKEIQPFLNQLKKDLEKLIFEAPTLMSKKRRATILAEIDRLQNVTYSNMDKSITKQMRELAKYELDFTKRMLDNNTDNANFIVPPQKQVLDAAFTSIMDAAPGYKGTKNLTIGNALSQFGTAKAGEVAKIVRGGFALGTPNQELAKQVGNVVGTKFQRQADALVRTITNHMASQSRGEFYKANEDLLYAYQVIATLDSRTTLTCQALDMKIFKFKEFERPPYHYNCRTTYIGLTKPEYDLGAKRTGERAARNLKTGKTTTVDARTTYNSWLKQQDDKFVKEILGENRAKLFKNGMNVDKFVDENYQPINLDKLRTKDNEHIFKAAGL